MDNKLQRRAAKLFLPGSIVTQNLFFFPNPSCISELPELSAAFHRCAGMASCPGECFSRSVPTYRLRTLQSRWIFFVVGFFSSALGFCRTGKGPISVARWTVGSAFPESSFLLRSDCSRQKQNQNAAFVGNGPKILFFFSLPLLPWLKTHTHTRMLFTLNNMGFKLFTLILGMEMGEARVLLWKGNALATISLKSGCLKCRL